MFFPVFAFICEAEFGFEVVCVLVQKNIFRVKIERGWEDGECGVLVLVM